MDKNNNELLTNMFSSCTDTVSTYATTLLLQVLQNILQSDYRCDSTIANWHCSYPLVDYMMYFLRYFR